ncbi:hypothetical protein UFOVP124_30 [uncultured Caudovirales phage]|uniref:Uncharacterized protein n=1 Tax=uncultured Caudovirales phage TaxID=2100421 RepID=A0A6J5L7Y7_9CAUD|nr:hypothetical protein UFOVP124_30 [uncultured Caudovirales phage]
MNTAQIIGAIVLVSVVALFFINQNESKTMSVSEKLNALTASVANVTELVKSQRAEIADLTTQIGDLTLQLATSQTDAATLQTQIDSLNALLNAPPPVN